MATESQADIPVLISLNQASEVTSLSRTMINKLRAEGKFPDAIELGERRIAFLRSDVAEWIKAKIATNSKDKRFKLPGPLQ